MSSDNLVLLFSFISCWLTLFFLYRAVTFKLLFLGFEVATHIGYSIYFLYGLAYRSENGALFAWWFNLILFLWFQTLVNLIRLLVFFFKKNKDVEV